MKSLSANASGIALESLDEIRDVMVPWIYSDGCLIDNGIITANEFSFQLRAGCWVILRVQRKETVRGNDYYEFISNKEFLVPGISMEGRMMLEPFVQIRFCQSNEVVSAIHFNQNDEQRFELGLVYEKTLVITTSLGRIFKFEPEETIAERIKFIPPAAATSGSDL